MPVTTTRPNRPPTPRRPPPRRRSTLDALGPATFDAHGSVEQVWLIGAEPGAELRLVDEDAVVVATAAADAQGSLIFRDVPPADYRVAAADTVSDAVTVAAPDDHPDAAFYAAQDIVPGYGYLETRDGTLLAINVTLPGPPEAGPYPTVIEYSGYSPADPDSPQPSTLITSTLGFATVGINLRGTGCSGGAYDYFEPLQSTDGYDAIETIAAQPWVEHGTVGMVGLSFPGITQLFVAATQPPHLSAIAPLSVIADTGRGTLRPGGILNDGFATSWATERQHDAEAAPQSGQAWAGRRIEDGDTTCADNQILRGQAVDLLATIDENPYWTDEVAAPVTPELFVDQITVPTFLAGAWQDEQVGGYLVNMTDNFTGTDHAWFTYTNGAHTDPFDPATFVRWVEFLQLYVARDVPVRPPIADIIMGVLSGTVWGTAVTLPPDRFAGATSYDDALATFEADPRVRIQFENGAGGEPGLPYARFEAGFDAWPPAETEARTWYFDADGALVDEAATADGTDSYTSDPAQSDVTTLPGTDTSSTWAVLPPYNWSAPPLGSAVAYVSDALAADTVMVGTGSIDLWVQADTDDVDLEVTLSEVRPDGNEVYVQSGWLRASQRALHEDATELRPLHTHTEADAQPLASGEWNEARVELFPFAHPFRAGSRIRVTVDAPGGSRPRWTFATLEDSSNVEVGWGGDHASRVVLPVVSGVDVPAGLPPCPSLRGQPCRAAM